ncbi:VOC family protein [Actinomadura alba]|uniref:VOC family protein n=1 Tax=Actinomadura alba TaxID=406431 RepID=A0ABR7M0S3_9ACTN|nr:VOC family protein [Actinomadura alba]MBC6470717.1 VOC family protein [Actinomadura alba]
MAPTFNLIGMVVTDMGRSLAFYRRLGLEIPPEADEAPHVEVTLPGGLRLAWDTAETVKSFDPSWTPSDGGGRIGLAFLCDDPGEVDRVYADFVKAGYEGHLEPWDAVWGQRYASLLDPDGNGVDLFAPLPSAS